MASISGLLGAVSKAVPFVSGDRAADETEGCELLLADSDSAGYLGEDEGTGEKPKASTVRKSSSDTGLREQTRAENAVANLSPISPLLDQRSNPHTSLRSPRAKGHRSSSNSQIETRSRAKGMISSETTRQWEIMARLSDVKHTDALKRSKHRCGSGTNSPVASGEGLKNTFEWRSSIRPNSDPDLRTSSRASSRPDLRKPLKTCLKHKAKSANATPPNETTTMTKSSVENQELRRVKTVDFEKAISQPLPPQERATDSSTKHRRTRPGKPPRRGNSCPGTALLDRRSPAYPAVTRTDVHVIAIAPSSSKSAELNTTDQGVVEEADPATPTMQIVESGNGSYEVVWDDVPPEHSARTRRRSSSASQALEAASAGTRGLERVNTKLTEWSGAWNTPSDSFKPTIIVFPDDDDRRPHFECAIVDDEDIEIFAPPNSERVSAVHSRRPSRPASARISRAPSHDESSVTTLSQDTPLDNSSTPAEQTLVMPELEAWSAHLVAARRKLGVPSPERKLSNVEEAELKFCSHRDSVTLAHSRLINSSGVRPELFTHRDSVTMAKERMHAKHHQHAHRLESKSEPGQQTEDGAAVVPPLPVVKAHAAEALKHGVPAPILRQAKSASGRHIRIKEQL